MTKIFSLASGALSPVPVPTCIVCDVTLTTRTAPRDATMCAECQRVFHPKEDE